MAGMTGEKRAWIKAALGVDVPESKAPRQGAASPEAVRKARAGWQDAIEAVQGQIAALQAELRKSGDDDLVDIAEYGLNAVTDGNRVRLAAALLELGDASAEALQKAGGKVLSAAAEFRGLVESDERVAVLDDNPFKIPVTIRATLGPALKGLEDALQVAV